MKLQERNVRLGFLLCLLLGIVLAELSETWKEYKTRVESERKARNKKFKKGQGNDQESETIHSRQKRNIGFPTGSTFKITPVLCIPVVNLGDLSGNLDIELPFTINLPDGTDPTRSHMFAIGRRQDEDRRDIFRVVESTLNRLGFNGRQCLLRAICEIAEEPLRHDGLFGEVLNIILSISPMSVSDPSLREYSEAEYYGRAYGDCPSQYYDCPISIFRLIED